MTYPNTQLFINGQWCDAAAGESLAVFNPATGKELGRVAHARIPDLDRALLAAQKGFETWRGMLPIERNKIMRKAAALMRERAGDIATMMSSAYVLKICIAVGMTPLIYAGHAVVERTLHMRPVQLDAQGEPVEHAGDPVRALDAARPD